MTVLTWLGCDLVTGQIVEELRDLEPQGTISSLLAAYTSASFRLPIPLGGHGAPPRNWLGATEPGRTMLVAVLNGVPVWAGIVLVREAGSEAVAQIGTVSLEGYLDRRYVGNHTWNQQDEASVIAAGLIADANVEGIDFAADTPATGTLRDRSYADQDDKTVYSALRELTGVIGGPEWTVRLQWNTNQTAVEKTVEVRKRIGHASTSPSAVFSTGSASAVLSSAGASEATYKYTEDYRSGSGANHVVATSSGEGDSRPQSVPARATALLAAGWPRWEYRWSPSSSITVQATLDGHAQSALAIMSVGAQSLTVQARADAYPILGTHWHIGDDVGGELIGHRHPAGLTGVSRAIGWELDARAGLVSPILLPPSGEVLS